jgi:hypothetical protein
MALIRTGILTDLTPSRLKTSKAQWRRCIHSLGVSARFTITFWLQPPVTIQNDCPYDKPHRIFISLAPTLPNKTYSGVKVTPVTSSASTIDTSGASDSGNIDGERGGGVGGVDDLDLPLSIVSN